MLVVDGAVCRLAITTDGRWAIASGAGRASLWDLKAADLAQAPALLRDSAGLDAPLVANDRWLVTHGSDESQSLKEQLGQARDSRQRRDLEQKLQHVASVTALSSTRRVAIGSFAVRSSTGGASRRSSR
jgi:hypothetical protein